MSAEWKNQLYFGDNLPILRERVADESVDLIYLDPPFKSKATYNVLFKEKTGEQSPAQIKAFDDTWHWGDAAAAAFDEVASNGPARLSELLQSFRAFLGKRTDMMAYLVMMAPRLAELRRVLKPTGSIYLHCDPTASHYLKILMDAVFGAGAFRNEIMWKRTPFSGSSKARARQLPRSHDVLLFYSRGETWIWNTPTQPYSETYLKRFKWKDERGHYRKTLLKTYSQATLERLRQQGRLIKPLRPGAMYSYKQYLDESSGTRQIDDVWTDINALNPAAHERLGYPTQKPQALLERIIKASSNAEDIVLDPFCGGGTTLVVAELLRRRWIGIDITPLAINKATYRLKESFPAGLSPIHYGGLPKDLSGAQQLARIDSYTFQVWAADLIGIEATPKGSDRGVDGVGFFKDDKSGRHKKIICQVKSGATKSGDVRDFAGTMAREKADIGVFICLTEPTRDMRAEAAAVGFYTPEVMSIRKVPKLQILTIQDLLIDKRSVEYPSMILEATHAQARRQLKGGGPQQAPLL